MGGGRVRRGKGALDEDKMGIIMGGYRDRGARETKGGVNFAGTREESSTKKGAAKGKENRDLKKTKEGTRRGVTAAVKDYKTRRAGGGGGIGFSLLLIFRGGERWITLFF